MPITCIDRNRSWLAIGPLITVQTVAKYAKLRALGTGSTDIVSVTGTDVCGSINPLYHQLVQETSDSSSPQLQHVQLPACVQPEHEATPGGPGNIGDHHLESLAGFPASIDGARLADTYSNSTILKKNYPCSKQGSTVSTNYPRITVTVGENCPYPVDSADRGRGCSRGGDGGPCAGSQSSLSWL